MIKRALLIAVVFAVFLVVAIIWNVSTQTDTVFLESRELTIAGNNFKVEIVDTVTSRARGLSGRQKLAEDEGMLFVFEKPAVLSFWMKDMKLPLDIIWILNNKVIGLVENAPIDDGSELAIYMSPMPVDRVLEINAGLVSQLDIKIGDLVEYNP
ncbi:MAG: DUF192 domain-containing protein [bacterium]|nr:DUF192 domain-containing protein [bacterium]